jgi:hypothetical protein
VPDDVNPFVDEKNAPQPLKVPGLPEALGVNVNVEQFDGFTVGKLVFSGPDFEWVTDPLKEWIIAPASFDESAAFVYRNPPVARLSLTLYKGNSLMPEITQDTISQYLAMVRADNPKGFILLTPLHKGSTDALSPTRFSGFTGQGFSYAMTTPTPLVYHVWIADMNHQYQLVIKLSAQPTLMDMLDPQIRMTLGRGYIRKGLGTDQPSPAPAPATGTAPRSDG